MHVKPVVAWRTVGEAWGLKKREVQRIIADNGVTALALLPKFSVTPDTLLRNCERHARGIRPDRRRAYRTGCAWRERTTIPQVIRVRVKSKRAAFASVGLVKQYEPAARHPCAQQDAVGVPIIRAG